VSGARASDPKGKDSEVTKVNQLGYVGIAATDRDAWASYATDVLGDEVSADSDDRNLYLRMDDYHHRIVVQPADRDDAAFIGWEVPDAATMQEIASRTETAGVTVAAASPGEAEQRRVIDFVHFTDPNNGVRTEVYYGPETMFTPAFLPRRPMTGYVTDGVGLGHVVTYVKDAEAAARFYNDALGLRVSDWVFVKAIGMKAAFLHCNSRHHSLAFFENPSPPRAIHHVMFETATIDDVGTGFDVCQDRGIVTAQLGRHCNDRTFSFYFRNPGSWHFELGWGSRVIDPDNWQVQQYDGMRPRGGEWGHDGIMNVF
jgi:2,3-dihydroxybiphenyl 1,2-dioxygenase